MSAGFKGYDEYGRAIYADTETVGLYPTPEKVVTTHLDLVSEIGMVSTDLCQHCGAQVRFFAGSDWVHETGRIVCRDATTGDLLETYAEPTTWEVAE